MSNYSGISYRLGQQQDLSQIIALLEEAELPTEDVTLDKIQFILAVQEEKLIGCAGLEYQATSGLLRSMAVTTIAQNQGIGSQLFNHITAHAVQLGIQELHLFTVTADKFFESRGFTVADRQTAPVAIQQTREFTHLCPSSCIYMVNKNLVGDALVHRNSLLAWRTEKATNSRFWAVSGRHTSFTYFEVPASKTFPLHQHESEQITYVIEGRLFFEVNGQITCVGAGDSIVVPGNLPHKVWTEADAVKAVDCWSPPVTIQEG